MNPVLHCYDNERGEGNPHAIKIELSIEDVRKYEEAKDARLGKWEVGMYVLVQDLDSEIYYRVASAPCGEGCHCAAVAYLADWVGIAVGSEKDRVFAEFLENADQSTIVKDGDSRFFDPPLAIHDKDDPDDGPLYIQHCDSDGVAANVWAPGCGEYAELERRLIRCVGLDATLDDGSPAYPQTGEVRQKPELRESVPNLGTS